MSGSDSAASARLTRLSQQLGLNAGSRDELLSRQAAEGCYFIIDPNCNGLALAHHGLAQQVVVDFNAAAMRGKFMPGCANPPVIQAVEGKSRQSLSVLDATAGLGSDSFILAARGHRITAIERHPSVALLFYDALQRCSEFTDLNRIARYIKLYIDNSVHWLNAHPQTRFDVIYFDPMFPPTRKSAKAKKPMQILKTLDLHSTARGEAEFFQAVRYHTSKLVVKRSRHSPWLNRIKPSSSLTGKANRFDIYAFG